MLHALAWAGWSLLWLLPYRMLYFLLFALGWFILLKPYDPRRHAGLAYVFWVTNVRDAIDRLLPVASVGGGVAAVRLLHWRKLAIAPVSATVIVEILLTLIVTYLLAVLGVLLLVSLTGGAASQKRLVLVLLCSLPVPVLTALLLRYGAVFARLSALLRPLVGASASSATAQKLDHEIRACLRRIGPLAVVGALQFAALICGAFEVWFALRLFGHPIGVEAAVMLEALTQSMRHFAFVIPGGLGVQEAGFVLFGHALGIDSQLALAVSMTKRLREVLIGLPTLASWQALEGQRIRKG